MNKIWLIFKREFLNRVQKKSFLIATIGIPLIFPIIIGGMGYVMVQQEKGKAAEIIEILDLSGKIQLENSEKYKFEAVNGPIEKAKEDFNKSNHAGLLYIPPFELAKPEGIVLYTKENPGIRKIGDFEGILEAKIHDLKLEQFKIDKETLKSLKTDVDVNSINLSKTGEEQKSNTNVLWGLGFALGLLIYMFVLIYGMQIMLGVIEEKTSKIVEVIVSSVKPFQLMMGKILGIAAVGLVQFAIWVILIAVLSTGTLSIIGMKMPQQQAMEQVSKQMQNDPEAAAAAQKESSGLIKKIFDAFEQVPLVSIVFNFAFFFVGGYLLYGALFAAVGSAVDSQQEAQQFTLPITLPLIIAYLALFMFILNDHSSTASFWFSIIPFTSPVAMMGRLAFGVPAWQLILSQVLLIGGFLLTTWIAARIYRVGILMSGTKVNYKILAKWFMTKV
jgi:ABC-2 type transport system permease protein